MDAFSLAPHQAALAAAAPDAKVFLEGPAGAGKTTAGVARLRALIRRGVPAGALLVLVPQRTLAAPYLAALHTADLPPGGRPAVLTIGGLAQRLVELFWPLAAEAAGFARPEAPPVFLTLETAQYHLGRVVAPLLAEGRFRSVALERHRLYSQILDNLNKAAAVGFPIAEIGPRLSAAWLGDPARERVFADVQAAAAAFRAHCLAHNVLDFSLQLEVFWRHVWPQPAGRDYLQQTYRHLIADNLEEDIPRTHDLLAEWLPEFESALLIYDQDAGLQRFLGADPATAYELRSLCAEHLTFPEPITPAPPALPALGEALGTLLNRPGAPVLIDRLDPRAAAPPAVRLSLHRFYPEMLAGAVDEIARLVHAEHLPPGEIVVLAPYLGDALRHALMSRLAKAGVPARSLRPSRALREEPATRCLLTLAALAHPEWGRVPERFDVAAALSLAIAGLDPVRAHLLAGIVYRPRADAPALAAFDLIRPDVQKRLTLRAGGRYEDLRGWLDSYRLGPRLEFDYFLARLFDEVLAQPGYGFHANHDAGAVAARLIESVGKFRLAVADSLPPDRALGQEYAQLVADGVLAAQSAEAWVEQPADAVLLAPAYTFLMRHRPAQVQFWLAVGDSGWFERPAQPLTHPYVLSRGWPADRRWTDDDDDEANRDTLYRLSLGLLRRCQRAVYLAASDLGEQGYEQRGVFLTTLGRALQRLGLPADEAGAR